MKIKNLRLIAKDLSTELLYFDVNKLKEELMNKIWERENYIERNERVKIW